MSIYYNLIGVDGGGLGWDRNDHGWWCLGTDGHTKYIPHVVVVDIIATEAAAAGAEEVKAAVVQRI